VSGLRLLVGLALPSATALLLVRACWRDRDVAAPAAMLVALTLGLGHGLASCTYWLALLAAGGTPLAVVGLDLVALLLAGTLWWRRQPVGARAKRARSSDGVDLALFVVVLTAAAGALAAFAANALDSPHGEWDAWAIWNTRARFLFLAGSEWRRAFSAELMHTNYPGLLPSAVAHAWTYTGYAGPAAPLAIALTFASALVLLMGGALACLRGQTHGLLGAACLLATPILLQRAAWQYADIPLAFFLLATVTLLTVADRVAATEQPAVLGLAGCAAGFAAWTKNEGALFVLAVVMARALFAVRARGIDLRRAAAFGLGLAPLAILFASFKLTLAPPSYLLSDQRLTDYLLRLADPARYATIAVAVGTELLRSLGVIVFVLPIAAVLLGRTLDPGARQAAAWGLLVILLMAVGYAGVYLVTPLDLAWQLSHSLDRLILQLWPCTAFAVLLLCADPVEWRQRPGVGPSTPRRTRRRS
jgi:hypothetical protein